VVDVRLALLADGASCSRRRRFRTIAGGCRGVPMVRRMVCCVVACMVSRVLAAAGGTRSGRRCRLGCLLLLLARDVLAHAL
jgi:hypothetical protein